MLISILVWIAFGFVVGLVARALYPGDDSMSWIATIGLGLVGSFVGGLVGQLLFGFPSSGFPSRLHAAGFVGSVLGSMFVLFLARLARRRALG